MKGTAAHPPIDWTLVYREALRIALTTMPREEAEEVVAAGFERVFAGNPPWDRDGPKSLAQFIVAVGVNLRRNERRKMTSMRPPDSAEGRVPTPEALYDGVTRRARRLAAVRETSAGDVEAIAVIDAEISGTCGLTAQMESLGLSEQIVRNARERVFSRIEQLNARAVREDK